MKFKNLLFAFIGVAMISLASCGDDKDKDEPEVSTGTENVDSSSQDSSSESKNPMVGKTITYSNVNTDVFERLTENYSFTFTGATEVEYHVYWTYETKDPQTGKWSVDSMMDNTEYGTYSYSDSEIKIYFDGMSGATVLTAVSNGWQTPDGRIYK